MKISTFRLMEELGKSNELHEFALEYREEFLNESPQDYLGRIMDEKKIKAAQMCEESGLGNYGYKLLSGMRSPSREAALRVAIGLKMDVEQAQHYLRLAQIARLDPRCYRDAAVIFALNKKFSLERTQMLLTELGEKEL